ncbi:hypothetical protein [Mycoplasma buteonis]|uniref:hypothetical protein n=1 Tax=Mycoplasma buteonis TaxID=171280 RepID=UPI00146FB07C|nr:hypothetical protein [Mycoplasma buteonis]
MEKQNNEVKEDYENISSWKKDIIKEFPSLKIEKASNLYDFSAIYTFLLDFWKNTANASASEDINSKSFKKKNNPFLESEFKINKNNYFLKQDIFKSIKLISNNEFWNSKGEERKKKWIEINQFNNFLSFLMDYQKYNSSHSNSKKNDDFSKIYKLNTEIELNSNIDKKEIYSFNSLNEKDFDILNEKEKKKIYLHPYRREINYLYRYIDPWALMDNENLGKNHFKNYSNLKAIQDIFYKKEFWDFYSDYDNNDLWNNFTFDFEQDKQFAKNPLAFYYKGKSYRSIKNLKLYKVNQNNFSNESLNKILQKWITSEKIDVKAEKYKTAIYLLDIFSNKDVPFDIYNYIYNTPTAKKVIVNQKVGFFDVNKTKWEYFLDKCNHKKIELNSVLDYWNEFKKETYSFFEYIADQFLNNITRSHNLLSAEYISEVSNDLFEKNSLFKDWNLETFDEENYNNNFVHHKYLIFYVGSEADLINLEISGNFNKKIID